MTDPERTDLIFPPDSDTPPSGVPVPLGSSETVVSPASSGEVRSSAASTPTSLQAGSAQLTGSQVLGTGTTQTASVDTSLNSSRTLVGSLELRMEVPRVEVRREASGQATVRRERRVREETVVVELVSEVLIIETRPSVAGGAGVVLLDGVELPAGETRELVIYREEAAVSKQTILSEEVRVYKQSSSVRQDFPTELAHEELVVEHRPSSQESLIQGASPQQVPNMGGSDEPR